MYGLNFKFLELKALQVDVHVVGSATPSATKMPIKNANVWQAHATATLLEEGMPLVSPSMVNKVVLFCANCTSLTVAYANHICNVEKKATVATKETTNRKMPVV